MKPFSEQDHYEILDIPRDATDAEIERACRMARATFAEGSLAGYSVLDDGEARAMRERVETAYRVLTHAETRSAYDAMLEASDPGCASAEPPPAAAARDQSIGAGDGPSAASGPIDPLAELGDEEEGDFDGGRLRRSRIHRGIELEDIAGWTKINPTYLRFIEEDRYAQLPAPVYVRGFVAAYAECIGLDGKRVARSYMKSLEAEAGRSRRGRFLAGR